MRNSRSKNIGWRIDYFLVDKKIYKKVKESSIFINTLGSDHAPIKLIISS
jgi:exodeoxyribonuclease-3